MSETDSIDFRQDRRQWLKTSATMLGASLLPLPSAAELPEQSESKSTPAPEKSTSHKPVGHFFTPAQHALVDELCETIIPADSHSGGAKAAKVADYIDVTLRDTFDDAKKSTWREGLRLIDIMSAHYHGKPFVDASPDDRIALLTVLSNNDHMTDLPEVRFFVELKRMTVTGYYTSKIGIHDELEYKGNRILKEFVGCDDQHLANS
jgi:hypothetical protein